MSVAPEKHRQAAGAGRARRAHRDGPKATETGRSRRPPRAAFSLLEVILALAILTLAIVVLGELSRLGMRSAARARDMTQAQLLCESKMAQISSGMIWPETEIGVPFEPEDLIDPYDSVRWLYSIERGDSGEDGVIAVRVTVSQDLPAQKRPVRFALVRWIADPAISEQALFELPDEAAGDSEKDSEKSSEKSPEKPDQGAKS